jgi:hypothetical protein
MIFATSGLFGLETMPMAFFSDNEVPLMNEDCTEYWLTQAGARFSVALGPVLEY